MVGPRGTRWKGGPSGGRDGAVRTLPSVVPPGEGRPQPPAGHSAAPPGGHTRAVGAAAPAQLWDTCPERCPQFWVVCPPEGPQGFPRCGEEGGDDVWGRAGGTQDIGPGPPALWGGGHPRSHAAAAGVDQQPVPRAEAWVPLTRPPPLPLGPGKEMFVFMLSFPNAHVCVISVVFTTNSVILGFVRNI